MHNMQVLLLGSLQGNTSLVSSPHQFSLFFGTRLDLYNTAEWCIPVVDLLAIASLRGVGFCSLFFCCCC